MPPSPNLKPEIRRQNGYGLLLMLAVLGLSVIFIVGSSLTNRMQGQGTFGHPEPIDPALIEAKNALIFFAANYPQDHLGETFGYLPLPDMGHVSNLNNGEEGKAAGGFSGNYQNRVMIGRLPWRTLGYPHPIKDQYGECLWYAVSGTFKDSPQTPSLNWDTLGNLELNAIEANESRALSGGNENFRPVAIIFSPGPALSGQNRSNSIEAGDNVTECGGNYDAINYLDSYAEHNNIKNFTNFFSGTTHNSLGPTAPTLAQFLTGPLPITDGTQQFNDQALYITSNELFNVSKYRSDFINQRLTHIISLLAPGDNCHLPSRGRIPSDCRDILSESDQSFVRNWGQHLFYLRCGDSSPQCLSVTWIDKSSTQLCRAALIFGGSRLQGQTRDNSISLSNSANYGNYLETPNLQTFISTATILRGNSAFLPSTPGTDVIQCSAN